MADFDVAVIGGGINGTGIARDAAGRGLKVLLVEQGDLAAGTSSASTKLIHGGLRYLEQRAFKLVRESLAEREVLLHIAPHLVRPMRFVLPVQDDRRPPCLSRLGLLLYDLLAWRGSLPRTRALKLNIDPAGVLLRRSYAAACVYSDCTVDDSRLVLLNAVDAAERGAAIRLHTRCMRVELFRMNGHSCSMRAGAARSRRPVYSSTRPVHGRRNSVNLWCVHQTRRQFVW